jgi:hypothetical protein
MELLIDENTDDSNTEIKDGQYVDTVIGRGIKYVILLSFRKME